MKKPFTQKEPVVKTKVLGNWTFTIAENPYWIILPIPIPLFGCRELPDKSIRGVGFFFIKYGFAIEYKIPRKTKPSQP